MPAPTGVPRVLEFVTAKRSVALAWRSYGHWWIEIDGTESYGWWPTRLPLGAVHMLRGVPGVLNGVGVDPDGTPPPRPASRAPGGPRVPSGADRAAQR